MRILIVGQGLAGTTLAWELEKAGVDYLVVDRPVGETASRVAAGLFNPIMGKIFRAGWRQEECRAAALATYPELEELLNASFWQRIPIWRELEEGDAQEIWQERQYDESSSRWVGPMMPWPEGWKGLGVAGYTTGSCLLQTEKLTNEFRKWLIARDKFKEEEIIPEEVISREHGIEWRGEHFDKAVWATGWEVGLHPAMPALKGKPSKGTVLEIQLPGFYWNAGVIHYGHWLVNQGDYWRIGSNYAWTWDPEREIDPVAVAELLHGLSLRWVGEPVFLRGRAAIRPTIRRSEPIAGAIPGLPHQFVYSGLGTKGVTTSPWVSGVLTRHLLHGEEIPSDLSPEPLWRNYLKRN